MPKTPRSRHSWVRSSRGRRVDLAMLVRGGGISGLPLAPRARARTHETRRFPGWEHTRAHEFFYTWGSCPETPASPASSRARFKTAARRPKMAARRPKTAQEPDASQTQDAPLIHAMNLLHLRSPQVSFKIPPRYAQVDLRSQKLNTHPQVLNTHPHVWSLIYISP